MSCKECVEDMKKDNSDMLPTETYMLEGGLGKHVMFTAMIETLAKKSKTGKINICSPYGDVFQNNKFVQFNFGIEDQMSMEFKKYSSEIIFREPYKSNFIIDNEHLLYYWAKELGIEYNKDWLPTNIDVQDKNILSKVDSLKNELGDFILVQFTGGQPAVGFDPEADYQQGPMHFQRNYPIQFAEILVNKIKTKYPDLNIIDFSLPNEHQGLTNAGRIDLPYIGYAELLKHSKAAIGIDSSLIHMAAANDKKSIGLYGGIPAWKFGWHSNINLTNFTESYDKFNPLDPYYISIDSNRILEELDKLL